MKTLFSLALLVLLCSPVLFAQSNEKPEQKEIVYTDWGGSYRSTDGGYSWEVIYRTPEGQKHHDMHKAAREEKAKNRPVVILSSGSRQYRSDDGGASWKPVTMANTRVEGREAHGANSVDFFPQPLGANGDARFRLEAASEVYLRIYDQLGNQVSMPIHGHYKSGENSVRLDLTHLPTGTYTYSFTVGRTIVQTGSVLILR